MLPRTTLILLMHRTQSMPIHSDTDTQKGRIEERASDSRAAGPRDSMSKAVPDQKRDAVAMEEEADGAQGAAVVWPSKDLLSPKLALRCRIAAF